MPNTAPTIDLDSTSPSNDYSTSYTEGGAAAAIGFGVTVTDPDAGDSVVGATITNTNPNPGDNFIVGPLPGGITLDPSSTTSNVILTGTASQASYAAALATVRFFSGSDDPTAGGNFNRIIHTTVTDGIDTSAVVTTTIAVTGVNDPPMVDLNGPAVGIDYSASYTEGGAAVAIGSGVTVTDPDSADSITSATITNTNPNPGDNFIVGPFPGGITLDPTSTTSHVILTGTASRADYAAALATIRFFSGSSDPTAGGNVSRIIQTVVSDGTTTSAIATTTLGITAMNTAPDITVGSGDVAAAVGSEGNSPISGSFTLTVVDPDSADTVTASVAGVLATGTTTGLGSNNAALLAMMSVTPGAIAADPGDANNLTWSFNSAPEAFDYLAVGESLVLTYTLQVSDSGAPTLSDTQDVTITVVGTNDAPVIMVGGSDVVAAVGVETNTPLSGSFTLTVTDADYSDSVTPSVNAVVASGTTTGLGSNNAALLAMMTATPPSIAANPGDTHNLTWTFNSAPEAFDYLAVGESVVLTYTLGVSDGHGGTDTQDVTVTISGSNDAPDISVGAGDVASVVGIEGNSPLSGSFTLTATDPDYSDTLTPSVTGVVATGTTAGGPSNAQFLGMVSVPASIAGNPSDTHNLTWSFNSAPSALDYLATGESVVLTYTIGVSDGHGGTDSQNVVVTINGTNDAPTIDGTTDALGVVTELPDHAPGENTATLTDSGTINFTDLDHSDTHTVTITPQAAGYLGTLSTSFSEVPSSGAIDWNFSVSDGALNYLGQGVVLKQFYDVTIDDGHGGVTVQTLEVDLVGTNDAAILSSANVVIEQGPTLVTTFGDLTITDEDNPALFFAQSGLAGNYGHFSIAANGHWTYTADAIYTLAPNQFRTDVFTALAVDGTPTTVAVTISGHDTPAIAQQDIFHTDEATPIGPGLNLFNNNGSGADTDPDSPLQIAAVNGIASAVGQLIGLPSGAVIRVNADGTFSYDPNHAFDTLTAASGAINNFAFDSFTYTLAGGSTAVAIINIAGANSPGDQILGNVLDNTITGLDTPDSFLLQQGGHDTVHGMGGDDGFYFGNAFDSGDSVDGGNGNDTLALQGNTNVTLGDVTNVENLLLMSGSDTSFGDMAGNHYSYDITTNDGNVAAGQTLTVIGTGLLPGENLHFDGSAETDGAFAIFAGQGVDSLTGGGGGDGFFFGADGNLTGADHVDGGAGIDTLALRGNYVGADAVVFTDSSMANIEVVALLSGHTNEYSGQIVPGGFDYDLTMADGNVAAGQRLDVIATGLGADESVRFDGRLETNGAYRILSGAGDDILWGGAGNDTLYGGLGADRLEGGAGADTYVYHSAAESTSTHYDTITGFDWHNDVIDIPGGSPRAFTQAGSGALSTATFDANLAAGLSGVLGAGQAALFTATSGTLAGHVFAVIDTNGVAGYQAGLDLVIDLVAPVSPIPTNAFVIA